MHRPQALKPHFKIQGPVIHLRKHENYSSPALQRPTTTRLKDVYQKKQKKNATL